MPRETSPPAGATPAPPQDHGTQHDRRESLALLELGLRGAQRLTEQLGLDDVLIYVAQVRLELRRRME